METLSDITIIVNTTKFKVHKSILALRSPHYFLKLFTDTSFRESKQSEIVLKDVDEEVFANFLDYIYLREYIADPALATICMMYTIINVDYHDLHRRMDIPAEQFQEYLLAMLALWPDPDQEHIDIIASKVPVNTSLAWIPAEVLCRITNSNKLRYPCYTRRSFDDLMEQRIGPTTTFWRNISLKQ